MRQALANVKGGEAFYSSCCPDCHRDDMCRTTTMIPTLSEQDLELSNLQLRLR